MIEHYSENIQSQIKNELSSATRSIKIAVAWFTNAKLFLKLISKMLTGVSVELVLNKDDINCSEDSDIDFQDFVNAGGIIHWCDPSVKLMHEKFCLIDDNIVIFGSYNWTNKAEYNHESISIARKEKSTMDFYSNLFEELCKSIPSEENIESKRYQQDFFYISAECLGDINGVEIMKKKDEDNGKEIFRLYNSKTKQKLTSFDYSNVLFHAKSSDSTVIAVKKESEWFFFNTIELFLHSDISYQNIQLSNNYDSFWVKRNGQWGIEKNDGTLILDCKYDSIEIKSSKYIITKQGNLYGVFDWCDSIWNCIFESIDIIKDGLFKVKMDGYYGVFDNNLCLLDCDYDDIQFVKNLMFIVTKGKQFGVINEWKEILPCAYDDVTYINQYRCNKFLLKRNGKYGLMVNGVIVQDCVYDEIHSDGKTPSCLNGKMGMLDHKGDTIIDFNYSQIQYFDVFSDYPYNAYNDFFLLRKTYDEKSYYGIYIIDNKILGNCIYEPNVLQYVPGLDSDLSKKQANETLESLRILFIKTLLTKTFHPSLLKGVKEREEAYKREQERKNKKNSYQNDFHIDIYKDPISVLSQKIITSGKMPTPKEKICHRQGIAIQEIPISYKEPLFKSNMVSLDFEVNNSFNNISYKEELSFLHSQPLEKNDILELPEKPHVICEKIGEKTLTYIIVKVYNEELHTIKYMQFNPSRLNKRFIARDNNGKPILVKPSGTASEIVLKCKMADEIYAKLTHGNTTECKIKVSEVKVFQASRFGFEESVYSCTFDLVD